MPEYLIKHFEHDGSLRDEFHPHNLEFSLNLNEPHDVTYDAPLALPTMRWGFVGPYRTTFELWREGFGEPLVAGLHTSDTTTKGEDVIHIAGKDWLHYLQRRHYPDGGFKYIPGKIPPFDIEGHANDFAYESSTGQAYALNATIGDHLFNILNMVMVQEFSCPINVNVAPFGPKINYTIEMGDLETIFDKIATLAENAETGFDFWIRWDKEFLCAFPHVFPEAARTSPGSCIHVFDKWIPPTDLIQAEFTNDGPEMTHIVGVGAGSSVSLRFPLIYKKSAEIFYRLDGVFDAGEIKNSKHLYNLTQGAFSKGLYPIHTVPITCKPNEIPDFWGKFRPGEAIWIREDFESRNINTAWQMTQITCRVDAEGEESVEINGTEINERGKPGVYGG
jgi:hypothetical protein